MSSRYRESINLRNSRVGAPGQKTSWQREEPPPPEWPKRSQPASAFTRAVDAYLGLDPEGIPLRFSTYEARFMSFKREPWYEWR